MARAPRSPRRVRRNPVSAGQVQGRPAWKILDNNGKDTGKYAFSEAKAQEIAQRHGWGEAQRHKGPGPVLPTPVVHRDLADDIADPKFYVEALRAVDAEIDEDIRARQAAPPGHTYGFPKGSYDFKPELFGGSGSYLARVQFKHPDGSPDVLRRQFDSRDSAVFWLAKKMDLALGPYPEPR